MNYDIVPGTLFTRYIASPVQDEQVDFPSAGKTEFQVAYLSWSWFSALLVECDK